MGLLDRAALTFGKKINLFIRLLGLGAGATWPGEIVLRLRPSILATLFSQPITLILIAGTNGKTTTAKMIELILRKSGKRVRHNASGANLDNGIVSAFLEDCSWIGVLRSEYFIFEVDEATLPRILAEYQRVNVTERGRLVLALLNLFRDQLDRYGEVDTIAEKWLHALLNLNGNPDGIVLINGDDPHLAFIGSSITIRVGYFGLEEPKYFRKNMQHATDTIYCPKCGGRLTFGGVYFSHLGKWSCGSCGLIHPDVSLTARDVPSPLPGVYNYYNVLAAVSVGKVLGISVEECSKALTGFRPAFGRMEEVSIGGKRVVILLSKNPTGMNESVRTAVEAGARQMLLVLNDRIPDGTDVSWIWDVDFETIPEGVKFIASGDRVYDLAVRLKYARESQMLNPKSQTNPNTNIQNLETEKDLTLAVEKGLRATNENETLWILPTYSAMLEVRKILIGRKIL